MTVETTNKHELRTRETRTLLLEAAETIFVRDGYEGAELGEIAALAGRTKGAIYAQFKSKEDIFLALVHDRSQHHRRQMEARLAKSSTIEGNIAALRNFYLELAEDQAWSLLLLEFKLYAMRHPDAKKRFDDMHERMVSANDESRYTLLLGPAAKGKNAISRVTAVQSLQPIISSLVLESHLHTTFSDKATLRKVANRLFDSLVEGT